MPTASRTISLACAGLVCLSLVAGCTSFKFPTMRFGGGAKSVAEEATPPQAAPQVLPPKEAARVCLTAAEELEAAGHADQAIVLYEKARNHDPSLASVSHHLAVLYDARGDGTRSLAEYNKAIEAAPEDPSLLSDFGYYHYQRGNLSEAEKWLRKALAVDPRHQKALCNLGMVLAEQGRFDESFDLFSKAVGPAAAHSNVGVLMAKQGQYDQARQAFHLSLAADPTLPQPKAFLAYLDKRQRSPQAAVGDERL